MVAKLEQRVFYCIFRLQKTQKGVKINDTSVNFFGSPVHIKCRVIIMETRALQIQTSYQRRN
ncbi:hypothetical protein SAMN02746073_0803 [Legionella jamestowniensis DSM 19215]|uniref:Uncharacterized protein n=1 Tax=Legionella jamestowniensis TaxID=455 RepID=A0A0W0UL69_9GAMM|nr:hypothetical protein Ljam_2852 [Legionella jamestowniensis]SFL54319.1 hypothetical protein SAMN02746073_0803 [Legionella jamestowniensis DSM 19215]